MSYSYWPVMDLATRWRYTPAYMKIQRSPKLCHWKSSRWRATLFNPPSQRVAFRKWERAFRSVYLYSPLCHNTFVAAQGVWSTRCMPLYWEQLDLDPDHWSEARSRAVCHKCVVWRSLVYYLVLDVCLHHSTRQESDLRMKQQFTCVF